MNDLPHAVKYGIQQALDQLPYDAFLEDATQVQPCVYDVLVSYDTSDTRGHETVVLDPATETFTVQKSQ